MNQKNSVTFTILIVIVVVIVLAGYLLLFKKAPAPAITQTQESAPSSKSNTFPSASLQTNDQAGFSVPVLYSKHEWVSGSVSTLGAERPALSIHPEVNGKTNLYPNGQLYTAINTDPSANKWQQEMKQCNGPCPFYEGDQDFLNYYDNALRSAGYDNYGSINLDNNLNIVEAGAIYVLGAGDADGLHGITKAYEKYEQGKMRVIVISSSDTKNSVFVSDVFTLQELVNQ